MTSYTIDETFDIAPALAALDLHPTPGEYPDDDQMSDLTELSEDGKPSRPSILIMPLIKCPDDGDREEGEILDDNEIETDVEAMRKSKVRCRFTYIKSSFYMGICSATENGGNEGKLGRCLNKLNEPKLLKRHSRL